MLISELIDATLNEVLVGTYRAHFNELDGAITDSADTITLKRPIMGIGENSYIEVDQELMYLHPGGLNETGQSLGVIRGVRGTIATSHLDRAGVGINPRFPRSAILSTIKEEARSWPISLFRVTTVTASSNSEDTAFDLADLGTLTDIIRVVKVWRQSNRVSSTRWIPISGWRFELNATAIGSADLYLDEPWSANLRVLVARPFDGIGDWDEDSDITDSGMTDSMGDILKYGAAWRLTTGRESRRLLTEVESEGRVAADVPASSILTFGRQLKLLRDARVAEEIQRLRSYYGIRGT